MKNKSGFVGTALLLLIGIVAAVGISVSIVKNSFVGSGAKLGSTASFTPVQVQKTYLSGAGAGTTDTSINITSLLLVDGVTKVVMNNFGSIGYATLDPGVSKKEENISFTGVTQNANGTAQLTGVTRGLLPVFPYTASTTIAYAHSGGATVVFSNSAPFYSQFAIANNTTTINANWTVNSTTLIKVSTDTTDAQVSAATNTLATVSYVNNVATSGAADAALNIKGIVEIAACSALASSTGSGGTTAPLVARSTCFSSTSSVANTVPVVGSNNKLSSSFIDTSASYQWTASTTDNATHTYNANVIFKQSTTFLNQIATSTIPSLAASVVTSTIDYSTSTTTFTVIGTSTPSMASTTIITGAHRVELSFTGTGTGNVGTTGCTVDFSVDGVSVSGGVGLVKANLGAGTPGDLSIMYLTDTLSAGSHTFRVLMKAAAQVCTINGDPANVSIWSFYVRETYN